MAFSAGVNYGPGTPKDSWAHLTPWLRRVLADLWGLDLREIHGLTQDPGEQK